MKIRPLDILVVGATGVGKSKTLNAFFRKRKLLLEKEQTLKQRKYPIIC